MTNALFKKRQSRNRHRLTTHGARPRLSIFRSGKHIYAQVIDDTQAVTVASASTNEKDGKLAKSWNIEAASSVGKKIAERTLAKGVKQVMFDRGGYIYHGRIKALADAAREGGLEF
jgi:large subunit ribosomal protein L18